MSKRVTKGQEAQSETYRANLARLERNRQRREQRAKRKAKMKPAPEPTPDKTPELPPESVGVGGAAMGGAFPSGTNECTPGEPVDQDGIVHGRPRHDPDLRIGRRSPHLFDGRRVFDVTVVRATDNARFVVRGLREDAAEGFMRDVVFSFGSDLVSVERTSRIEY